MSVHDFTEVANLVLTVVLVITLPVFVGLMTYKTIDQRHATKSIRVTNMARTVEVKGLPADEASEIITNLMRSTR